VPLNRTLPCPHKPPLYPLTSCPGPRSLPSTAPLSPMFLEPQHFSGSFSVRFNNPFSTLLPRLFFFFVVLLITRFSKPQLFSHFNRFIPSGVHAHEFSGSPQCSCSPYFFFIDSHNLFLLAVALFHSLRRESRMFFPIPFPLHLAAELTVMPFVSLYFISPFTLFHRPLRVFLSSQPIHPPA